MEKTKPFNISKHRYDWQQSQPSARALENKRLAAKIKEIFIENYCNYSSRRIKRVMNKLGITISRRRISKLMKAQGLYCKVKRKFRVTTDSKHQLFIAPNLLQRNFTATSPNQKYVGDIIYRSLLV